MEQQLNIFEFRFNNEELENNFKAFFIRHDLLPLFTNEHRTGNIKVGMIAAQGVANEGGAYAKDLKEFSDVLTWASDNKSYEEAIFKIIYQAKDFGALMQRIRNVLRYVQSQIADEHLFNLWNIVWYNKDLP